MFKGPIIPASGVSPISATRWANNPFRTGCIDYSSVRYKSNRCNEMLQTTLCRTGCINYFSVRYKSESLKQLGNFDHIPIIPASGRSSRVVRRYGQQAVFGPSRVCALHCSSGRVSSDATTTSAKTSTGNQTGQPRPDRRDIASSVTRTPHTMNSMRSSRMSVSGIVLTKNGSIGATAAATSTSRA
jgi:hypothetical protein